MRTVDLEYVTEKRPSALLEAGLFTWEVGQNVLHADKAVANIFGLDSLETQNGLPVEAYLARVFPEDRATVAKVIHDTILSGEPEHQSYRAITSDGTLLRVMVFGQCFRNDAGIPTYYAGIVHPLPETDETTLPQYCSMLYDLAIASGEKRAATFILAALQDLVSSGRM